ncbi:MAG: aminoacyl-tRNA hydrolase [Fibrobacter sp.]|jgi:PTH1 family peptidyl-tRNA hydrolase|nr:aminoacyl-tRNA hydrolase [Fibrobacter sp.]
MGLFSFLRKLFHRSVLPESIDAVYIGLGNPGEYAKTRHNIGFRVADALSQNLKSSIPGFIADSEIVSGVMDSGKRVLVVKPQTFMNRSGVAVEAILRKTKVPFDAVMVIVDDINLPLGAMRARRGGSHGGHNGLKSIIEYIGPDFPRLRIGIGPPPKDRDLKEFVLGEFSAQEEKVLKDVISKAVAASICFLTEGVDVVMNKYNK